MGRKVPYTRYEDLSDADKQYLGDRAAKSPAIGQLLKAGDLFVDLREVAAKLDLDTGVTDTDYEATVID